MFKPKAAEASQIHPSTLLAAAAWSCLSSKKVGDKKITKTREKRLQKTVKDVTERSV